MGRKTSSSKALSKKQDRLRLQQRLNACAITLKEANSQDDPLASLPSFHKFALKTTKEQIALSTVRADKLDEKTRQWAFQLVETNMKSLYSESSWGWNAKNKKEELFDERAYFLLAKSVERQEILAFAMFRFDLDCDDDVLYVYELQLERNVRRQGLGRFMLQILEVLAVRNDMTKIMLTVFKHNQEAKAFFVDAMKFDVDETCPEDDVHEQFDYLILSRMNKRKKPFELA